MHLQVKSFIILPVVQDSEAIVTVLLKVSHVLEEEQRSQTPTGQSGDCFIILIMS